MDDLAIEIVANVYKANDSFISGYDQANVFRRRLGFELDALSKVKILGTIARVASRNQCISKGEYGVLARLLTDCQNLIGAWYKSDRLRLEKILLKDV